jgi:transposase
VSNTAPLQLGGMPEPAVLRRHGAGGETLISHGRQLVFRYADDDTGMRNMAVVALTDAGVPGREVAAVFGLSPEYVSRLRAQARRSGAAGLVRRRGRPPKLSEREVAKARRLAAEGVTQTEIAARLKVARSVISELLARLGPAPAQEALESTGNEPVVDEPVVDEPMVDEPVVDEPVVDQRAATELTSAAPAPPAGGLARLAGGVYPSRYAGAALLYPYLDLVGAASILATVTGGPSRRYDDLAVLSTATVGFALGIDTVEGAKHLRRADAGAVVGLTAIPELRTFRSRLSALADGSDPLGLQRAFAKGMLAGDPPTSPVYYVDDHFVAYTGARPVAKGYNTKRHIAEPGRADTLVADHRGRAVCFASGEPSGLTRSMPGMLAQLREVTGPDSPILLGFDRGGAYPTAFTACRQARVDWLTYRRGKLAEVTAAVRRSWCVRDGRRISVNLADEMVDIPGYGQARQLTLHERGMPVLQVLTSDTNATGAALLLWLRGRWGLENVFKYAAAHNGIDAIASYPMDIIADDRKVANPARRAARGEVAAAEATLAAAERALAQTLTDATTTAKQKNGALPGLHRAVQAAQAALTAARDTLNPIPAELPATELDPNAKRARMRLQRRGLQMVCRLLAFNAEAWLAQHLGAYLADPDEYRAIMRNLLHLGGHIDYQRNAVTVTLDRPDTPRVARALELLADELNASPAHLLGDHRPVRYKVAQP